MAEDVKPAAALEPAPSALVAEPGEPAAWLHEIYEPGKKDPLRMLSFSSDNPWSHWMAEHLARCRYQCTPLAAPPARQDGALREALHDRFDSWWREHHYDGADLARGAACDAWCSAIDAALAQSAAPVKPEPAAWPSGFFPLSGDARLRKCVTHDCGQHASIRIERDGVGSDHCEPCARKIAEFVDRPVQQAAPSGEGE